MISVQSRNTSRTPCYYATTDRTFCHLHKVTHERAFRKSILDCLVEDSWKRKEDQQNWHLTADMIEEIRDLAEGPDSNFFQLVFVTVKYAIIRKNNAAYRGVNSSEYTSVILEARHAVDLMPNGLLTAFEHDDAED